MTSTLFAFLSWGSQIPPSLSNMPKVFPQTKWAWFLLRCCLYLNNCRLNEISIGRFDGERNCHRFSKSIWNNCYYIQFMFACNSVDKAYDNNTFWRDHLPSISIYSYIRSSQSSIASSKHKMVDYEWLSCKYFDAGLYLTCITLCLSDQGSCICHSVCRSAFYRFELSFG